MGQFLDSPFNDLHFQPAGADGTQEPEKLDAGKLLEYTANFHPFAAPNKEGG
jgi:hypothetical protein